MNINYVKLLEKQLVYMLHRRKKVFVTYPYTERKKYTIILENKQGKENKNLPTKRSLKASSGILLSTSVKSCSSNNLDAWFASSAASNGNSKFLSIAPKIYKRN